MRYGKIRVEDGNLIFFRHMIQNNLPCRDIVWAYIHREGENAEEAVKQMISNYLVIITRRKKRYQFEMTEHEAQDCLRILKLFNPEMATGFPKGGRITMRHIQNVRAAADEAERLRIDRAARFGLAALEKREL